MESTKQENSGGVSEPVSVKFGPCGLDGTIVELLRVQDRGLIGCCGPFPDRPTSLPDGADCRVDQLGCNTLGWEATARSGDFLARAIFGY